MKRWLLIGSLCGLTIAALATLVLHNIYVYVLSGMLLCFVAVLAWMSIVYVIARRMKRLDVVDAAWGINFAIIAVIAVWFNHEHVSVWSVQVLVLALVWVWAARLSTHITRRILQTSTQDVRYTELQKKWKQPWGIEAYGKIFVVQAVLATIVSIPVIHIGLWHTESPQLLALVGAAISLFGIVYETIADRQLSAFLSNPSNKGKLMTTGLRRYSRYPNYFGELCMWWGVAIISFDTRYGWVGLIGALTITYLLCYVSGVPLAEKSAATKRGWSTYRERTNVLLPMPSKS